MSSKGQPACDAEQRDKLAAVRVQRASFSGPINFHLASDGFVELQKSIKEIKIGEILGRGQALILYLPMSVSSN